MGWNTAAVMLQQAPVVGRRQGEGRREEDAEWERRNRDRKDRKGGAG